MVVKNAPVATHKGFVRSFNDFGRTWLGKKAPAAPHTHTHTKELSELRKMIVF